MDNESEHAQAVGRQSFLDGTPFKVVGVVASIASVLLLLKEALALRGPAWSVVLAVFLVALTAASIVVVVLTEQGSSAKLLKLQQTHVNELRRSERESRVALALPQLSSAFHWISEAVNSASANGGGDDFRNYIKNSLAEMARVFSTISGTPCRMSVKELIFTGDDLSLQGDDARFFEVRTFCRHDRLGDPSKVTGPDRIVDNTDYRVLFEETTEERFFFCADVHNELGYLNSHARDRDLSTLNYRSNVVWPVEREIGEKKVAGSRRHDLWGFLCVDSMATNVFDRNIDVPLGAAYADVLYAVFSLTSRQGGR